MFIPTVGGSIGISDAEERVTELRRASNAKEIPSRRRAGELTIVWKIIKIIIFFVCLTFLIVQSVDFRRDYYKYPTTIVLETTLAQNFKLPAITLCFRNTISFKDFCLYEPDRCERPSDVEEFCRKHPTHCQGDNSTLKIPIQDEQTSMIVQHYLLNDSYNDEYLFANLSHTSKTRTFMDDYEQLGLFFKCYSSNLHLYQSRSKAETFEIKFLDDDLFAWIEMSQQHIELFYPIDMPKVFVGLHSPYRPIDIMDLYAIRPGKEYLIDVQLGKEEHLLPPPYQTNCRDNGPSEDAKESTNPNSFQVCLGMCESEFSKAARGCDRGIKMFSSPSDMCHTDDEIAERPDHLSNEEWEETRKNHLICTQNCKQGCLKLQYKYKVKELDLESRVTEKTLSYIGFYVMNPEVTVLRHVPLYGSGDMFSYIGGLLGCWLGVSLFTFTNILEKFFRNVTRWKRRFGKNRFTWRRFRKRKGRRAPPISEIHHH